MEIMMVGNGGAFGEKDNNNALIRLNGEILAIDLGFTHPRALKKSGVDVTEIHHIVITHEDDDHAGALGATLQKMHWQFDENFNHKPHKPTIYLLPWQKDWFELRCRHLCQGDKKLSDYADIVIVEHDFVIINDFEIKFIDTTNLHCVGMPSFGIVVTDTKSNENFVYTSDIAKLEGSDFKKNINKDTRAIFQDTTFGFDPVHANFDDILNYYPNEYHHKLYLMHLPDDFSVHIEKINKSGANVTKEKVWVKF